MHRAILLLSLALALFLGASVPHSAAHASGAARFPVTVVDDLHDTVHIARQPKRIISLDPADTEILFALGLEKRVVGDGGKDVEGAAGISRNFRYPSEWPSPWGRDYPVRAKQITHVEGGYGTTPFDLETIENLRPDLIVSLNSDLQTIGKLRDLGIKVIVDDPTSVNGVMHDIDVVGKATGASKGASVVVSAMRKTLNTVRRTAARAAGRPRVYYEIDATNPAQPYTAGPGTFLDDAIHIAHAGNVMDSITSPGCPGKLCYPQIGLESLVSLNPQIIILGDAAYGVSASSVKSRSGWNTISAVQSGKIYPFDDELISRPGPRVVIGIETLARLIHPQLFKHR